jgi:hypothetical protein
VCQRLRVPPRPMRRWQYGLAEADRTDQGRVQADPHRAGAKELAKMVAKHLRATASAATGHVASNAATSVALPQPRAPLPPTQPEVLPTPLPPTQPQGPPTQPQAPRGVSKPSSPSTSTTRPLCACGATSEELQAYRAAAGPPRPSSTSWQSSFDQTFLAKARKIWRHLSDVF